MIHIVTVHWKNDKWIDIQLKVPIDNGSAEGFNNKAKASVIGRMVIELLKHSN
jgi:hypothetical protein